MPCRKNIGGGFLRHPISWLQHREQFCLKGAGLVHGRIVPRSERWQAHQHALDPGSRLQPEESSPVVHQIEFSVTAPAYQLEVPLALAELKAPPALDDVTICGRKDPPDSTDELEKSIQVEPAFTRPQMIEEDASNTAPLVAPVNVHEVVIAPGLEARIKRGMVAVALGLESAMEMDGVFGKRIRRSQVGATPEPCIHQLT